MVTQEVELGVSPTRLLTRCAGQPFVFALDGGDRQSWGLGCALLGFRPRATLRVAASGEAVMDDGRRHRWHGEPFALLDRFRTQWASGARAPFAGGVLAALSYDLRRWVERAPQPSPDDLGLPVLHAAYYDWLLSYSYAERAYRLASAHRSAAELRSIAAVIRSLAAPSWTYPTIVPAAAVASNFTKEHYVAGVGAALDYIAAGDVYQINLAQRFAVRSPAAPAAVFAALQLHTVPFGAYLDGGDFVLISNSPECLLTLRHDQVATFPIKGTRPRGRDPRSDRRLIDELQRDAKERAEHVMIVDLERNDLGRVCRTGSVTVDELATVQSFPTLHHLVSKVSGRLRPATPLGAVLHAIFPGGSITGAPKVRAMEIIDTLEPVARGFYTGAIGWCDDDGTSVFNLAIRTAVATRQQFTYHAGGGIVADSVPDREYEETLLKAQPFFAALTATAAA